MMWIAALAMLASGVQDGPALTPGTVTVEAVADEATPVAVRQVFADAVEQALLDARFIALPRQARGRYIARISLTRAERGAVASNGREQGASGGFGNWGGAVSVTLPSDKRQLRGLIVTTLKVELVSRADERLVWSGSALTAQAEGTRNDTPSALAAKLAPAVIRAFPATLAEPLSVP
ncbi:MULTISPECIES: DUF4136 domain-containing protein [unclassified Sphingomonas]|uniref:DUF4136 domain-containing protein n=1 Tax=unclassified Sphingomonas TaxID=196159 RepID=UPI0021516134|nr:MULTISPECIES: DUF4136 domain-containing protein [unclassified Sphingomonas]MCR5869671.1 DUF4136 domain-containing protein [Sphingomonas sp. J344]UUX98620.1 DUF4136 domain-containing protein [Sphingomonas sp. J315]